MTALVYDYKSIAAHMKGGVAFYTNPTVVRFKKAPQAGVIHAMDPLSDELIRRLKYEWNRERTSLIPFNCERPSLIPGEL